MKYQVVTALAVSVVMSGLLLSAGNAQAPDGVASSTASTDTSKLPGDNPPPSGMMAGPPPGGASQGGTPQGGAGGKPPQEPGTDAPGPSLALALEAAQAALAACKADGYNVGVTVIDSTGEPRVALSADKATGSHVYTAVRKGLAALAFNLPTSKVQEKMAADKDAAALVKPNMATMAGAVPLAVNGKAIGAIGVSGASSQQDEKCAVAGEAKIHSRLK